MAKPSFAISSIIRSFIRAGLKVRHHQQSLIRNIPKMRAFALRGLEMSILTKQRGGDLEKSTPNFC